MSDSKFEPPISSDLQTVAEAFEDRTADEKLVLDQQFRGTGYNGLPYIAPPAPGHDTVGLWHYFDAHSRAGYSTHAIATHSMLLDALKVPTSLVPHRMASIDIDQFPKDRSELLTKWLADAVGRPEAIVVSLPPDVGMYDTTRALVNYVAGPECTLASEHAKDMINDTKITALWCVSDFTARAYLNAGVEPSKTFVVRPPICDGIWRDMFKAEDDLVPPHRSTFIFGTLGTWHERKGFHDLIRAYFSTFRRSEDVELHIRTSSFDSKLTIKKFEEKVVKEISDIAKEFGDNDYPASKKQPRIKLLTGTALSEQGVIDWLGSLDAYVNPSYGEGLGIPPMWATAQGVPLITSDFGAVGEFARATAPSYTFPATLSPVPASMRAHSAIWGKGSSWGTYPIELLGNTMRLAEQVGRTRLPFLAMETRRQFSYDACRAGAVDALRFISRPEIFKKWFA